MMTEDEIVEAFIAAAGWKLTEGSADALRGDVRKGLLAVARKALTPSHMQPANLSTVQAPGLHKGELDRAALTPSPTPYVRPAAEIRAEIERYKRPDSFYEDRAEAAFDRGFRAGLTFALTPPTTEKERR